MRRPALVAFAVLMLSVTAATTKGSTSQQPPPSTAHLFTPISYSQTEIPRPHVHLPDPPPVVVVEAPAEPPAPPEEETPPPVVEEAPTPPVVEEEEAPAPPPPVPSGDVESAIANWFPDNYQSARNVAQCESGMDPSAISDGGGNWGLFQINTVHRDSFESVTGQPWSQVLNANYNAQFAAWLYASSGGWGPWACRWAA